MGTGSRPASTRGHVSHRNTATSYQSAPLTGIGAPLFFKDLVNQYSHGHLRKPLVNGEATRKATSEKDVKTQSMQALASSRSDKRARSGEPDGRLRRFVVV